jgi:hypothetical protein
MNVFNRIYQYINILSLDVAAGSVICALFFSRVFNAPVSLYALAALALTVWIIYTIDHLRDARIIPKPASTDRHRFHQETFTIILIILAAIILIDFAMTWYVPVPVLLHGFVLWLVVVVYLIFQRYLKFLKEVFVACLYTGGILLPSLATAQSDLLPVHYILIAQFCLTALINLLLFSLFDYEQDRHQHQHSFVTWFGPSSTRKGILLLGLLNVLSCFWLWSFDAKAAIILMLMNIMLLVILLFQKYFFSNNYYRIMGDAIFFIPVFYLL